MTNLDYEKGNLTFDNLIIKDITKEIETPFYCYSLTVSYTHLTLPTNREV